VPTFVPTAERTSAPTSTPAVVLTLPGPLEPSPPPPAIEDPTPTSEPSAAAVALVDHGDPGTPAGTGGSSGGAAPRKGPDPAAFAGSVIHEAAAGMSTVVRPAAAAAVATTFSFPLALMLAVLLFLLLQRRLDDRDPKLRAAPRSTAEARLEFEDEDRL
jgi:hypothetical protein